MNGTLYVSSTYQCISLFIEFHRLMLFSSLFDISTEARRTMFIRNYKLSVDIASPQCHKSKHLVCANAHGTVYHPMVPWCELRGICFISLKHESFFSIVIVKPCIFWRIHLFYNLYNIYDCHMITLWYCFFQIIKPSFYLNINKISIEQKKATPQ